MKNICRIVILCLLIAWRIPCSAQEAQTLLIRGGTVIDGTGKARRAADIRILGDRILQVGHLRQEHGEPIIDAHGLIVAPGFIDCHSHVDEQLLEMPDAEGHVRQGITTSIVGQDGSSHFPLEDWFARLEQNPAALNIASFVGHGTVRGAAMGKDYKRTATPNEIAQMQALVEQEMKSGALGLSSGLEYDPGFYSNTEELIACAQPAGRAGGLYISHVRDEGNEALKSFQELMRISAEGHLPAQISHIKLDTRSSWGQSREVIQEMESARRKGLDITADVYPYLYWQSTIGALIPSRDWDNRALWEKGLADVGDASHVLLTTYSPDASWQGKTIAQIAAMTGKDPIAVIQQIVHSVHDPGKSGSESVVVTAMTDQDLDRFIGDPHIMFCSDGSLHGTHPRGAGAFPRVLAVYVRERHVLTLEQAVHKMTQLAARRMGFRDRGEIRTGMKADLVLFDADRVRDMATTADPQAAPQGIPYVLVNGVIVIENGVTTHRHPGRVLRRSGS